MNELIIAPLYPDKNRSLLKTFLKTVHTKNTFITHKSLVRTRLINLVPTVKIRTYELSYYISGKYMSVAVFTHTDSPNISYQQTLIIHRESRPVIHLRYLQHERNLWAEAQQVQRPISQNMCSLLSMSYNTAYKLTSTIHKIHYNN